MLTTFEYVNETHKQCAQLLTVEGVLLLCKIHFNLSRRNIIQQDSYQLQQEPEGNKIQVIMEYTKFYTSVLMVKTYTQPNKPTEQRFPRVGLCVRQQ